jgi:hypothetical protein
VKSRAFCFTLLSTIAISIVASLSAQAQRARVFVSVTGNDANPCTALSPCRTFQATHSAVAVNGEISVLDSGGFGPVVITKPLSIVSPLGVEAGVVAVAGSPAIEVAANSGGIVLLRGLTLDGAGVATDGIFYLGGDRVEIVDCVVRNFVHDGLNLSVGNGFTGVKTFIVSNTIASDNGSSGIEIAPQNFFALRGALDGVTTAHNGQSGILIDGTNATNGGFVDVAISNTISESNSDSGITARGLGNEKVEIKNATLSNNTNNGLAVSNARTGLSTSSLVLNGAGFSNINSGTIFSFVDNIIENNRDPNTGTLTTATRQ